MKEEFNAYILHTIMNDPKKCLIMKIASVHLILAVWSYIVTLVCYIFVNQRKVSILNKILSLCRDAIMYVANICMRVVFQHPVASSVNTSSLVPFLPSCHNIGLGLVFAMKALFKSHSVWVYVFIGIQLCIHCLVFQGIAESFSESVVSFSYACVINVVAVFKQYIVFYVIPIFNRPIIVTFYKVMDSFQVETTKYNKRYTY